VYFNRITSTLVLDIIDYVLISYYVGLIVASRLKKYASDDVSEKVSMARLKNAIIKKSRLVEP
jgi:hypothetical protein